MNTLDNEMLSSSAKRFFYVHTEDGKKSIRPRPQAFITWIGCGLPDWDALVTWRAVCQKNADSKDKDKRDRRVWQKRAKAARLVCDLVWPKRGQPPRKQDIPGELAEEITLAIEKGSYL